MDSIDNATILFDAKREPRPKQPSRAKRLHVTKVDDPSLDRIEESDDEPVPPYWQLQGFDRTDLQVMDAATRFLGSMTYADLSTPSLSMTPKRMAAMYRELLTPREFEFTTFDAEGADQMVVVSEIPFYTLCEHHLLPFFGTATLAYLPSGRIAGLSKLPRTVEFFARRLQTQERMTNQIATYLQEHLDPQGVGVVLRARHLCMEMRGVQRPGTETVTSALLGAVRDNQETRAEFLALARGGR